MGRLRLILAGVAGFAPILALGALDLPEWGDTPDPNRSPSAALWPSSPLDSGSSALLLAVDVPDPVAIETRTAIVEIVIPELFDLTTYRPQKTDQVYDPQRLLSEPRTMDVRSFLNFHREESSLPIRIMLFAPEDHPRAFLDLQGMTDQWLENDGGRGCVLVYFLGEPERSRIFLPKNASNIRKIADLEQIAERCIRAATVGQNQNEELDRFGVELSIQLFSLEKKILADRHPGMMEASNQSLLTTSTDVDGRRNGWWSNWSVWRAVIGGLMASIPLATLSWILFAERTSKRSNVYLVEELELPVRLGGQHSGGAGIEVHFGCE